MKKKLAIFDLDGTLFDTRAVNFLSYQQALKEEGYSLEREFYESKCNGRYYKDYLPLITGSTDAGLMERVHNRKKELYPAFLSNADVNEHLFHLIRLISPEYHIAIVTTASKTNCYNILEHYEKLDLFELILTQEDVKKSKPDPEGFIKAMEHFGVESKDTLIFEDSDVGIEAARRSCASILVALGFNAEK